jgi:hypothetical protein
MFIQKLWTYFANKSTNNLVWSCHVFLTVTSICCHPDATTTHGRSLPSSSDHRRVGHTTRGPAHQPLNSGRGMEATQESRLKRRSLLTFSPKRQNFPGKASNSTQISIPTPPSASSPISNHSTTSQTLMPHSYCPANAMKRSGSPSCRLCPTSSPSRRLTLTGSPSC